MKIILVFEKEISYISRFELVVHGFIALEKLLVFFRIV